MALVRDLSGNGGAGNSNILDTPSKALIIPVTSRNSVGELFNVDTFDGHGGIAFQATGTWGGTIAFEQSMDRITWAAIPAIRLNDNVVVTTITATGNNIPLYLHNVARYVRARVSAYTSGTMNGSATWVDDADITGVMGGSTAVTGTVSLGVGAATIGYNAKHISFLDTATALTSSQVVTGTGRDSGVAAGGNNAHSAFGARLLLDQAATLRFEQSADGTTWFRASADIALTPAVAGTPQVFEQEVAIFERHNRIIVTNGATAQGTTRIVSRLFSK